MRADILEELGLSPLWKCRQSAADTPSSPAPVPGKSEKPPLATAVTPTPPDFVKSPAIPPTPPPLAITATPEESAIAKMQWQPLRLAVADCRRCALSQQRTQAVFGVGDRQARIVFVGEGPGYEEDKQGEPFVGAAGQLLDLMFKSIGLKRGDGVYVTNIVKCRPPKNRNPRPEEAGACMPYLRRQLALIKPRLIVALGGVAAAHLLQTDERVGELRQRLHDYHGIPLAVTYHPAYLLRSPAEKRKSWDDLCHIRRLAADSNN